ncbi:MAG: TolC family protein [Acidobacteriota bacterium]
MREGESSAATRSILAFRSSRISTSRQADMRFLDSVSAIRNCRGICVMGKWTTMSMLSGLTLVSAMPVPAGLPAEEPVALAAVVEEAVQRNPELQASKAMYEASTFRPSQEGALPDPTIGIMSTSMTNPIPLYYADPIANVAIRASQEIPYPGKRRLASEAAKLESEALEQSYQARRLAVIAWAKEAYFAIAYYDRALRLLGENLVLLDELSRAAQTRYAVGTSSQQDVLRAQTEISVLTARKVAIEQQRQAAVARLNGLLNRPAGTPFGTPVDYPIPALPPLAADLREGARARSPELRARQLDLDAAAAKLELAKKQLMPDFMLGASYGYSREYRDMWQLNLDLKVPLYRREKQKMGIQEETRNVEVARRELDGALQTVTAGIEEQYAMAAAAWRLITLYDSGIIPQARLTLEASLSSYKVGEVDFLTVVTNFISVLEYRMNYYEQVSDYQKALSQIEQLAATELLSTQATTENKS